MKYNYNTKNNKNYNTIELGIDYEIGGYNYFSGADYLKRNTNELVFYSEKMNLYFWGITHFGTSWDGVYTSIKV